MDDKSKCGNCNFAHNIGHTKLFCKKMTHSPDQIVLDKLDSCQSWEALPLSISQQAVIRLKNMTDEEFKEFNDSVMDSELYKIIKKALMQDLLTGKKRVTPLLEAESNQPERAAS